MPKLRTALSILGILERSEREAPIKTVRGIVEGPLFSGTPQTAGEFAAWRPRPRRAEITRGVSVLANSFCTRFGDVYDEEGRRLNNVSHKLRVRRKRSWLKGVIKEQRRWLTPCERIDVPVLNLTASTSHMYFHWLLDVLPRFFIARAAGLEYGRWLYVSTAKPFQKESLEALGLLGRTIDPDEYAIIHARDITIPCHQVAFGHLPPEWAVRYLRTELLTNLGPTLSSYGRRLYVSRNDAERRLIVNEDELIDKLSALGFENIVPGQLTVSEQAAAFANAEIIVGAHGSSLANMVFCRPTTIIIELFSYAYFDEGPHRLSQSVGMNYSYVRERTASERGLPIEVNYRITPEDVLKTLEMVGVVV